MRDLAKSKSNSYRMIRILGISLLILIIGVIFVGEAYAEKGTVYTTNGRYFKKEGYFLFKDSARMVYKDYVITADTIEYYEDEERANFSGNVVVLQGETKITSIEMEADLKKDEFLFEQQVDIYYVRKKKETSEEKTENDIITIKADKVNYKSGDTDHLVANGQVIMDVDEDHITGDYLEYIEAEDKVIARGDVLVIGKDDEKINCEEFVSILEGEEEGFIITDNAVLEFTIDDDEEEESSNTDAAEEPDTDSENAANADQKDGAQAEPEAEANSQDSIPIEETEQTVDAPVEADD